MHHNSVRGGLLCLIAAAVTSAGCLWEANAPPVVARPTVQTDPVASKPSPELAPGNNPGTSTAVAANVELKILDYDGIQKLIQSHKGKVVVVDCWSTYWASCIEEFPGLVELHKKHGDSVACVSLSFNYDGIGKPEEQKEDVLAFLQKQGATFDNVLSSDDSDTLNKKFQINAIPVVFVYDRDGNLAKKFENTDIKTEADAFTYEKDVNPLVEELVKKPAGN